MPLASFLLAWALILGAAGVPVCPLFPSEHERFGVNVVRAYGKAVADYDVAALHAGWYVDYSLQQRPARPANLDYAQTLLRTLHYPIRPGVLGPLVDANVGALWILGNEPDSEWQDPQTPAEYAVFYHDAYAFLKQRDPTARIAVAGVVQPTPLRLRYLDMALAEYRRRYGAAMPVDIWSVHGFILQEVPGLGASIPMGLEQYAAEGKRYTFSDHGRIDLFRQQIVEFRRWMAARGYRNRPLLVTEYGILLPPLYGYTEDVVADFMLATFRFLQTATDPAIGYPSDGNRLVQSWAWYSLNDRMYDLLSGLGFNGNLLEHDTGQITGIGAQFAAYTAPLVNTHTNLAVLSLMATPSMFVPSTAGEPLTVTATLVNGGNLPAQIASVRFYLGDPHQGGRLLAEQPVSGLIMPRCATSLTASVSFSTTDWPPGRYWIYFVVEVKDPQAEKTLADNKAASAVVVLRPGEIPREIHLPALFAGTD